MEIAEFVGQVPDFHAMTPRRKICLFGWFLHVHRAAVTFDNAGIRECFRKLGLAAPNVAVYLPRMADSKPPDLIHQRGAYQLARPIRTGLDSKYGAAKNVVIVTKLLADLPAKVPDHSESVFLDEALNCYKVCAYRAATVMVWNLAFHHVLKWIVAEPHRLSDFNAAILLRFPKRVLSISRIDEFQELKEVDIIEVCRTARLFSKNIIEILREKLKRRNLAAHPSQIVVTQGQADDTITDLVNNVVLALV